MLYMLPAILDLLVLLVMEKKLNSELYMAFFKLKIHVTPDIGQINILIKLITKRYSLLCE